MYIYMLGLNTCCCRHPRPLAGPPTPIDSPCECEPNNPDSLDARLFFTVVLAVAPAVTMDEASSLSTLSHMWSRHSPPSLRHFAAQGVPPPVVVLGCGFSPARVWLRGNL